MEESKETKSYTMKKDRTQKEKSFKECQMNKKHEARSLVTITAEETNLPQVNMHVTLTSDCCAARNLTDSNTTPTKKALQRKICYHPLRRARQQQQ